jgi:hypothetical protein
MRSRVEVVSLNPGVDQLFLLVFSLVSNISHACNVYAPKLIELASW